MKNLSRYSDIWLSSQHLEMKVVGSGVQGKCQCSLSYIGSLRQSWATGDPISKQGHNTNDNKNNKINNNNNRIDEDFFK